MQCLSHVPSVLWNNYCHILPAARGTVLCWVEMGLIEGWSCPASHSSSQSHPFPMMICRAELRLAPHSLGLWCVAWGGTDRQTAIRVVLRDGVGVWLLSTNKNPTWWKKRLGTSLSLEGIRCNLSLKICYLWSKLPAGQCSAGPALRTPGRWSQESLMDMITCVTQSKRLCLCPRSVCPALL